MKKIKILWYSEKKLSCLCCKLSCLHKLDIQTSPSDEFFKLLNNSSVCIKEKDSFPKAAILCSCSSSIDLFEKIMMLKKQPLKIPIIIISNKPEPDFIVEGAKLGFENYIDCSKEPHQIEAPIVKIISKNNVGEKISEFIIDTHKHAKYLNKLIDVMAVSFPHKPKKKAVAEHLGVTDRWLLQIIKDDFGMTYREMIGEVMKNLAAEISHDSYLSSMKNDIQFDLSNKKLSGIKIL